MGLSERKKKILAAVVDEYIATAEPVGSKHIAENAGLRVSSATIRNELAELTSLGYLQQPHTSAGRVPTPQGYRIYVNELMDRSELSKEEAEEIRGVLSGRRGGEVLSDAGKLTADMTNYPALALTEGAGVTVRRFDLIYIDANTFIIVVLLSDNSVSNKLVRLPFSVEQATVQKLSTVFNASFTQLPEEEITPLLISSAERSTGDTMGLVAVIAGFAIECLTRKKSSRAVLSGGAKLLQLPEFRDPDKAHRVMDYLSEAEHLYGLPGAESFRGDDVKVLIGPENIAEELKDSSVILAKYDAGDGTQGIIGVVGPTRMDYAKVAAKLSYIAALLSGLAAGGGENALPGFGKLMLSGGNDTPNTPVPTGGGETDTTKDG